MVGPPSPEPSGLLSVAFRTPRARREEREIREIALYWLDFTGLGVFADRPEIVFLADK
jgi:ABC-type branched-subunit amino acid transport system ATPase component